jgi:hypothetical protein
MTSLCLCRGQHHWKLLPGYADAFRRRGIEFFCVDDSIPLDAPLEDVLQTCPGTPSTNFDFESAHPLFPIRLERSEIPTVCFHPDTYAFTERRIHWSAVFDHAAVHPGAFLLPHAVRKDFFLRVDPSREFEIGWIGQTSGEFYKTRAQWLPKLAQEFHTNDWSRSYSVAEVANVYRRSQTVVNIGRDDFPQDASLRVFEVPASGSLLLTAMPTELTQLGFQQGTHFVGYCDPAEIVAPDYLESAYDSPFMILTAQVRPEKRSVIPSLTHVDGSARPQTVEHEVNPLYYRLIDEFGAVTGVPVIMNTSFNLRGEAIVNTPTDALRTFLSSGMDALVIGSFLDEK